MATPPLPFETDPELIALLDDAEVYMDAWIADFTAAFTACFGQPVTSVYSALANSLMVAGQRALAGYQAQGRRATRVRHFGISSGAVRPPRRETAASRARAEAVRWGLAVAS